MAASASNEWYYRTRFERSGDDTWLLEFGRYPSAWTSAWFRSVIDENIIAFLRWCRSRGVSLGKIARWLNANGPSPTKGEKWHKSTVRYLLDHRSPDTEDNVPIKRVLRLLKGLRWAASNQQPWLDQVIAVSNSVEERARRTWEMHRLLLPAFRALSVHLAQRLRAHERAAVPYPFDATGMQRRSEFGLRYLGTPSLRSMSLRTVIQEVKSSSAEPPAWTAELERFELAVPEFLDFRPTKLDMELLGRHKASEALLRILCKLEGLSTRSAHRHRSSDVQ
jgi:hypothetical protein